MVHLMVHYHAGYIISTQKLPLQKKRKGSSSTLHILSTLKTIEANVIIQHGAIKLNTSYKPKVTIYSGLGI